MSLPCREHPTPLASDALPEFLAACHICHTPALPNLNERVRRRGERLSDNRADSMCDSGMLSRFRLRCDCRIFVTVALR